jgi:hypothetical protein
VRKTKEQWIDLFRKEADRNLPTAMRQSTQNKKSDVINKCIKQYLLVLLDGTKAEAKKSGWTNEQLLNEVLLITNASYIVMLEYRNKVWPYEYMAFARRIGELWEPFCKLPFEYPVKDLKIIEPQDFGKVQAEIKKKAADYINTLEISTEQKRLRLYNGVN